MIEPNRVRMIVQVENGFVRFGLQTFDGSEYDGMSQEDFAEALENLPADKVINSFFAVLDPDTAKGIAQTLQSAAGCADGGSFEDMQKEVSDMPYPGVTLMSCGKGTKTSGNKFDRKLTEAEKEFIDKIKGMFSE